MENSYHIRMSLFPNLNSDRHSDSVISFRLKVKVKLSYLKRSDNSKISNEHHSFTFVFTFVFTFSVVVVVDLPTDCIFSFLFPAETDALVPVFSQSTDVVVVNFVVVLECPVVNVGTTPSRNKCKRLNHYCACSI